MNQRSREQIRELGRRYLFALGLLRDRLWRLAQVNRGTRVVVVLGPSWDFRFEPNVVVCELAHLGIVDTQNLGFFVAAETEARNVMHDP